MKRSFYLIWIIGAALFGGVIFLGIGFLSAMALHPNGNVSPTPWAEMFGATAGVILYWSALCWAIGLLRSKPIVSVTVAAATVALAYGYPAYVTASYDKQRAAVAGQALRGDIPTYTGKTAVLLWGVAERCQYNCWNLSLHMAADVYVVKREDLLAVDFNGEVDLTALPLYQIDTTTNDAQVVPVQNPPDTIDFALMNIAPATDFDGAFDRFVPAGLGRDDLHIDALILPTRDGGLVNLGEDEPVLRLMSVRRSLPSRPWFPMMGSRMYWNSRDRGANDYIARAYFCTTEAGTDWHWCSNAFD